MTWDEIQAEYQRDLQKCQETYLNKWVRFHRPSSRRVGPGLVEAVGMSHRAAVCTVRWADNKVTQEPGYRLEVIDDEAGKLHLK